MLDLDPKTTALVLIDLQDGIVGRPLEPHSGLEVLKTCRDLADAFRSASATVVLVRVAFADDFSDAPTGQTDQPTRPSEAWPPGWSALAEGLVQPSDLLIVKRHWGAFHGTELDLLLRRRGIKTIVLGGIATNFGVESTVREAWQHDYDVVVVEDATASTSAELHDMAIRHILPRVSRVRASHEIGLGRADA